MASGNIGGSQKHYPKPKMIVNSRKRCRWSETACLGDLSTKL